MIFWLKNNAQNILICLLVVLFAAFLAVMLSEVVENCIGQLLGLSRKKNDILTFLGFSMGGILLALQAVIANKRAEAMVDAANAQSDVASAQASALEEQAKANQNTEKGQRQERMKNAIEHLGHKKVAVRLGGAYELFHLAQDTKELRQTVLDILCAHIRQSTSDNKYKEDNASKPSEEIQSLLTLLFVRDDDQDTFKDLHIDLKGSWLNGAKLVKARMKDADLTKAYLMKADLRSAMLHRAKLLEARLHRADLSSAELQGATLFMGQMQMAILYNAQLHKAGFEYALLQGVNLGKAVLKGANLYETELQGANLYQAQFQEAYLKETKIQGTVCTSVYFVYDFEEHIRSRIGEKAIISNVIFTEGSEQYDLDYITDVIGAVTKPYNQQEAEVWIDEFNEATSAVSEDEDR